MRLVIHIGLNKAASTWLQHSLASPKNNEIFYDGIHPYFQNHNHLNDLIKKEKKHEAVAWIKNYAYSALSGKFRCAIISSEDIWQELPFNHLAISALEEARVHLQSSDNISTRYLIIKRDFKKWAFSYLTQLINNSGDLSRQTLHNLFHSSVTIAQFPIIAINKLPSHLVDVISCDESGLEDKIRSVIDPSFQGLRDRVNVSRPSEMSLSILSGAARSLYSSRKNIHPNDKEADLFIDRFRLSWEKMLSSNASSRAKELLAQYDSSMHSLLQEKIADAYARLDKTEKAFWSQ